VESRLSVDLVAAGHFGYLLKDRVLDVGQFLDALQRVAAGGSALDPEVVARLMVGGSPGLASLTPREREVLSLMAEGLTNAGIASRLVVAERTVETHVARILGKLGLAEATPQDHRRVLAVLRYLEEHRAG
jgi:DNA-binding NarL/FixJ family response regulator